MRILVKREEAQCERGAENHRGLGKSKKKRKKKGRIRSSGGRAIRYESISEIRLLCEHSDMLDE